MTARVSLMVLPTRPDDDDAPAQFFIWRHGTWHEIPFASLPRIGLTTVRVGVDQVLRIVMAQIGMGNTAGARVKLQSKCREYWNVLLPAEIRTEITNTLQAAAPEPAELHIHTHPKLEWLPWELLNDEIGWLALRCRITRLPIVKGGPTCEESMRPVRTVSSLLGARVFEAEPTPELTRWEQTFDPVAELGVHVERHPDNGSEWAQLDNVEAAARNFDIIHFTCHGGVDDNGRPFLVLNPDVEMMSTVDVGLVEYLKFPTPGPLVFSNACGAVGGPGVGGGAGLPGGAGAAGGAGMDAAAGAGAGIGTAVTSGLGVAFFDGGVSAYIGTVAQISRGLAVEFATEFYRRLLTEGHPVGEALRLTKVHFFEAGTEDPSWLFYCLYGSPDTRFVPNG